MRAASGLCVLRISGELDLITAHEFAGRVAAAVQRIGGPVVADLSGLALIDARGGRMLVAALHALPGGRRAAVQNCPPQIRLVLDTLGLSLNHVAAESLASSNEVSPWSATRDLVDRVQRARLTAGEARLGASWILARLAETGIRLASARERLDLIREQGKRTVASTRSARADVEHSRHDAPHS